MASVRITGVQMVVSDSEKENLPRILDYIKSIDTDFMLFPEMSLTGYHPNFGDARDAWAQIATACRQRYTTAIIGTGAHVDGKSYIQSRVISDAGDLLGTYEKIVPTKSERAWCRPGESLPTFASFGVKFGCLICNDLWVTPGCGPYPDPRLSYQLGQKGVQVIFHSVNSGTSEIHRPYHESNLSLRAMEAGVFIATANAASRNGHSVNAPTGIVAPNGEWLVRCPLEGEHVYSYDLDLDQDEEAEVVEEEPAGEALE